MDEKQIKEVNTRLEIMAQQRNQAMDNVVVVGAQMSLLKAELDAANEKIKELTPKEEPVT